MKIRVAEDVRFSAAEFGDERFRLLDEALAFENPEYKRAVKEMFSNANSISKHIHLAYKVDGEIVIPRGNLEVLREGLWASGIYQTFYEDNAVRVNIDTRQWKVPTLREDQIPAVEALLENRVGVFKGPTASGKTVVVLETIRRSTQKSLVIVGRSSLARQWVDRAREHLGVEAGLLGAGENDIDAPIVIAMQQTLWSRVKELDEMGFWRQFGFVCVDEAHHCKADTYLHIVSRFPSKYRVGVSATPDHDADLYPLVEAMVGPVVYEVKATEATDNKVIGRVKVYAVDTDFRFNYIPTHPPARCPGPACPFHARRGRHQNNWQELVDTLIVDEDRNNLIVQNILLNRLHRCQVVVSRRLAQLDAIFDKLTALDELTSLGYPPMSIKRLTGKETKSEQEEVCNSANAGTVILSTIADEGLDIPRLDTIHLVFPGRNPKVTEQQVGRIRRLHREKNEPLVYDYVDRKCGPLKQQYYSRTSKFYFPQKMEVVRV